MESEITYEKFDWKTYIKINSDLKDDPDINSKETAWKHWIFHGYQEERPISAINNTNVHNGRFGNLFFINMVMHFVAIKLNLKCRYKYFKKFERLGIYLYVGENNYDSTETVTDENFLDLIQNNYITKQNIAINNENWFQTKEFALFLNSYFNIYYNKYKIISNNIFKNRYNNNNDLFIHVRLGDMTNKVKNIHMYYEKILSRSKYITGYISSDSIESDFCKYLINKYNLIVIDKCEIEIIMFGSTCNTIILSGGTFSWLIGFFAFFSKNIHYPNIKNPWYGNIFSFRKWNSINF
jgi:hypothetical protein